MPHPSRSNAFRFLRLILAALALAVPAASAPTTPYVFPFRSIAETFWRPVAGSDAPRGAEFRLKQREMIVTTPCYQADLLVSPDPGGGMKSDGVAEPHGANTRCGADAAATTGLVNRLRKTRTFRREADRLVLLDSNNRELVTLEPIVPNGVEYRWLRVLRFRAGGKMLSGFKANHPYPSILFYSGEIEGFLACGDAFGNYRQSGGRLKVTTLVMLAGPCDYEAPQPVIDAIYDDFNGEHVVEQVSARRIILRDARGAVRAVLAPLDIER